MVTFGEIQGGDGIPFDAVVSDDRRALTMTFSDLAATVDASSPALVAKEFSLVLPLEAGGAKAEIEFSFSGASVLTTGASATLMVSVGGQSTVRDFGPNPDDESFVHTTIFRAEAPSECRLFVLLLAGRDSRGNNEGSAFINVLSIDAEVLPRNQSQTSQPSAG